MTIRRLVALCLLAGGAGAIPAHAAARIDFKGYGVALAAGTPGDDDGFADAGETIDMALTLINRSGFTVDDLNATLLTDDPRIECISTPIVALGSIANGATVTSLPFRFRVAGAPTVERSSINEVLQAALTITLRSDQHPALTRSIAIRLDLDLNAAGGGAAAPFVEDFEGAGLGTFTLMTLDAGKNSLALSDGMRCQYNDPAGPNSQSVGRQDCFLGFPSDPAGGVNDWHVQRFDAANCNSGRAYTGTQSLRWGTCPFFATTPVRDTTRFKQLDAVRTIDPINLPLADAAPELTFKHQASLIDNRNVPHSEEKALDRGVVQIQYADAAGNPVGPWLKLYAYENDYDQQATDVFPNCMFDPTDDGNSEDDFFNPQDPFRRLGPSSTCFPEFVFARSGHTDWRLDFNPANVGLAVPGPGLQGNQAAGFRNPGTWVQPRFNLAPYAGRRVRLRFVGTSIELDDSPTWDFFLASDNVVGDDGWFIDDVRVDAALTTPVVLTIDGATLSGPACPACAPFGQTISVSKTTIDWPVSETVDVIRGNLIALRASVGNFIGTVAACLADDVATTQVGDASSPGNGGGFYYLVRPAPTALCASPGYGTGLPKEIPGRDAEIEADPNACP